MHQPLLFPIEAEDNRIYRYTASSTKRGAIPKGTRIRVLFTDKYRVGFCLANDPMGYYNGIGECSPTTFAKCYELVN